jgi:hypothetical protein
MFNKPKEEVMLGVHKETYKIDGKEYTAVIDFVNDGVHIYGRSCSQRFHLDVYENFEGNMEEFVTKHTQG